VLRLYTFLLSHFSEKARWALDFNGVAYDERRLLPVVHVPTVRRRAKRTSVPVLVHDDAVIQGSTAILDHIEDRLDARKLAVPAAESERGRELEAIVDKVFGLGTQRIFYGAVGDHRRTLIEMWSQGGPSWARTFYKIALPLLQTRLNRMYDTRPAAVAEAKDAFRRLYDDLDEVFARQPYVLGDTLTRVDVTIAALLAPTCRPPEHVFKWPPENETPPTMSAFTGELADRPTSRFVSRMYREHRH
jgi:glutathione S-transferase